MIEKIKISELTSEEARQNLQQEAVLLIPMGSLEDQGTHAPMGDFMLAERIALDIATKAREAGVSTFVAPVIPFGGKDYFDSSIGGISLRHQTLTMLLEDMFASLIRHGLKRILIINGHGGNSAPISEIVLKLRHSQGVFITSMYLWQIAHEILPKIIGSQMAQRSSGHGANPVTSVGLHYFPQFFRPDLMRQPCQDLKVGGVEVGGFGTLRYDGVLFQAPIEACENAPHGLWGGDPHLCSAQTGEALVDELVRIGVGFIRDHVARDFKP